MKERQRWKAEEDAILRAYVKQYGPREWNLVSQRMSVPLDRDAKSCLERWKNYLKPGIKKGSLTEEEQRLVIRLQANHGNKWKKIAAEVPGRTAKRLGKWWEVFQDKKQREIKENNRASSPIEPGKYDRILENFAEKLVKEREVAPLLMATPLLPPWLSNSNSSNSARPPSPCVSLTLASSRLPAAPPGPWPQSERGADTRLGIANSQHSLISGVPVVDSRIMSGLAEYCKELEEGQKAWMAHKNEATWRLRRVELQMETEKACKKREKMDEMEKKMRALGEEQQVALDRIEAGYKEQLSGLRRDAEAKEQKLAEQWAAKHMQLSRFLEQMGCCQWPSPEMSGR